MKALQKFCVEVGVVLGIIGVLFSILYTNVYTENGEIAQPGLILISEVMVTGGVGRANDEFVELYNPGSQPVTVGGWSVSKLTKNASSTDYQNIITLPVGLIMSAKTYVLLAHVDSSVSSSADYLYAGSALSDDNSVVVRNESGAVVDLVGYGLAVNCEGVAANAPSSPLLSIERKPGGLFGNEQDTNQNQADFFKTNPNPQNRLFVRASSTELAVITTTSTPEVIGVTTTPEILVESVSSTPVYPPAGSILITEIYPSPKTGEDEFVEILNRTPEAIEIDKWYLEDGSGAKTILDGQIGSMDYLVIEKPKGSLNNAGDLVKLINPIDTTIDQVSYGDWNDGAPGNNAPGALPGYSIMRVYDAEDSNLDYYDFAISVSSTKGRVNIITAPPIEEEKETLVEINSAKEEDNLTASKVVVKKTEPLYARVIYQATSTVGTEIFFDASLSTGGVGGRQYLWEMDDGAVIKGEFVKHTYLEPDTYSVILTVSDETGAEKHKTVKVKILPDKNLVNIKNNEVVSKNNQTVKIVAAENKKPELKEVFVQMNELFETKTNTQVRVRAVLAAVLANKSGFDYYVVAESSAGGSLTGVLLKTKNTNLDARIGDLIEITGKYIINQTTGNYLQFTADDQLSVIQSGEIITPASSTIKSSNQLFGGFVQIQGRVVEKKTGYLVIEDGTGEVRVNIESSPDISVGTEVLVTGYLIRTKTGIQIRTVNSQDLSIKIETVQTQAVENVSDVKHKKTVSGVSVIFGILAAAVIWLVYKKWFSGDDGDETEI